MIKPGSWRTGLPLLSTSRDQELGWPLGHMKACLGHQQPHEHKERTWNEGAQARHQVLLQGLASI